MKCSYIFIHVLLGALCSCQFLSFENSMQNAIWKYIKDEPDSKCSTRLQQLLASPNLALPFLDAMGKPISGAIVGNLNWFGNYELCLELKSADLLPCKTYGPVALPNNGTANLIWTSCLPPVCKDEFIDIIQDTTTTFMNTYLDFIIKRYELNITIPDLEWTTWTDWTNVARDVYIDCDLEECQLQIKSDSTAVGNEEKLFLKFATTQLEDYSGHLTVRFTDPPQYYIQGCMSDWTNFETDFPAEQDKIWTISKNATCLKMECNGVSVLEYYFSKGDYAGCASTMGAVEQIMFHSRDTVSNQYRITEQKLKIVCQEDIEYDAGAYVAIVICLIFLTMTLIGTLWGPVEYYISWFLTEFKQQWFEGNGVTAELQDKKTEIGIVITNELISDAAVVQQPDAHVMMDVKEMCKGSEDKDMSENLYETGAVLGKEDVINGSVLSVVQLKDGSVVQLKDDKSKLLKAKLSVKEESCNVLARIFKCFSLQKNLKILLDTSTKPGQILCMNGIRVLSIGWVVLSHMYLIPLLASLGDGYQAFQISKRTSFDLILNGFPSVDSFFVMSGFLVSYLLIKNFKNGKRFSGIAFGYYIHRYIRLTVPYAMVILIQAFLYRQYITGPFADNLTLGYEACKKWWWTNILYVNNFVPWKTPSQCIGQTWYLANDMQFFIVAPLFIYLLWAKPLIGHVVCWGCIVVSMLGAGIATYVYDFGTTPLRSSEHFAEMYTKPYIRIVPYLIGIMGGWFYSEHYKQINEVTRTPVMSKLLVAIPLWIITIMIEYGVVFGIHSPNGLLPSEEEYSMTVTNAVLSRIGWAVALLTQIFLCQTGMGGPISTFLSWRGWLPLSRLTYSVYLLHYGINIAWVAQLRHVFSFAPDFQTVIVFLGFVCAVNCASALLFLVVEQPVSNLEKWLLTPAPRKRRS